MRNAPMDIDAAPSGIKAPAILPVPNATVPYWRTDLHEIDEHRSTPTLPSECDIAIIGSGMSGVGTAYHLEQHARRKREKIPSIVMLEARQVCSGATGRNGGHSKIQTYSILNYIDKLGLEAATEAVDQIREQPYVLKRAVETEKLDCEFELRRSFDVFLDETDGKEALNRYLPRLERGESWTKVVDIVDPVHVRQVTSLKDAATAFSVPIASFWPYKFVSQLLSRLIDRNAVNLQTNTPVLKVTQFNGINILHTPRGTLKAKKVVFATNAYTAGLLPSYTDAIVPTLATATHITPASPISPHLSNTYNINYGRSPDGQTRVDYLNPRPDGGIVVGGGQWTYRLDRSKWYNRFDDSVQLDEVRPHFDNLMQTYFKGWESSNARMDRAWTGVIGTTADGMPHIGEVPGSGRSQYIVAGFNGGGMGVIFSCTKGLATMVAEGVEFEATDIPRIYKATRDRQLK